MTDKRFEIFPQNVTKDGTLIIIQKGLLKLYNINDVVDLLNTHHEEKKQLKQQINLLKLALCEELQDNGNACYIRIFDDLFGLNYDEWESKYEYPDWEEILKNKKELEE